MRCFFHLANGDQELLDQDGIEVSSLDEARAEALKAIAELRREEPRLQENWNGWRLRIVDETARTLSTIQINMIAHPVAGRPEAPPPSGDALELSGDPE